MRLTKTESEPASSSDSRSVSSASSTCAAPMVTRIPRTPLAERPIERTSVSAKRMALPSFENNIICCSPSVMATPIKVSSSFNSMARKPLERTLPNCSSSTRLTVPAAVAIKT